MNMDCSVDAMVAACTTLKSCRQTMPRSWVEGGADKAEREEPPHACTAAMTVVASLCTFSEYT